LLPGSLALSVAKVLVYHLGAINRLDLAIKSSMPALVLNTVLNLFLIPSHGIVGAAVATSISYLFYAMISIHLYSSLTGLNVSTLIIVTRADFELLASTVKRLVRRS
jgi:O-antigen/teichoic acid export membrane protein